MQFLRDFVIFSKKKKNAALQAKTVYSWEYMSPEGLALNSKWDEAEKYICNPLSGEVPMECLSAKTLSGRSFRQLTSRITMSAPLIYPARQAAKPPMPPPLEINQPHTPIPTQGIYTYVLVSYMTAIIKFEFDFSF